MFELQNFEQNLKINKFKECLKKFKDYREFELPVKKRN